MHRTKSEIWRKHGLVDFKFKDLNLDIFTESGRRWQWHLFRVCYEWQIAIWIGLDVWTVFGLAKEPDVPKALVVIQGVSSFAGIFIMIGYRRQAKVLFDQGDLSDTFSDGNARLLAAAQDFRVFCLFILIYSRISKNMRRLMSLRSEFLDWRTLFFTQTPQLYVLLGYAKLIRYSKVIVYIKIILLVVRLLKLCIMLISYPFVRCTIMALTKSLNVGIFEFCSFETEKVINDIIISKTSGTQQAVNENVIVVATP